MAASSSSNAIGSTWYTSIDLDPWFPSISAIRQAALEIGGVVSPKEGLVVGCDVTSVGHGVKTDVKDDLYMVAGPRGGLLKSGRLHDHEGQLA